MIGFEKYYPRRSIQHKNKVWVISVLYDQNPGTLVMLLFFFLLYSIPAKILANPVPQDPANLDTIDTYSGFTNSELTDNPDGRYTISDAPSDVDCPSGSMTNVENVQKRELIEGLNSLAHHHLRKIHQRSTMNVILKSISHRRKMDTCKPKPKRQPRRVHRILANDSNTIRSMPLAEDRKFQTRSKCLGMTL